MTMPKKGRREIVVNNTLYYYKVGKIKRIPDSMFYESTLVMENTETGKVVTQTNSDVNFESLKVTPKIVSEIIQEKF